MRGEGRGERGSGGAGGAGEQLSLSEWGGTGGSETPASRIFFSRFP